MGEIKRCPRCDGNVFMEWDYGDGDWYEYCLQCSYRHYLPAVVKVPRKLIKGGRKKRSLR